MKNDLKSSELHITEPAWDYRFMIEQATTIFTKWMEAKQQNNSTLLKDVATPDCYTEVKSEIENNREPNMATDIMLQGSFIVATERKESKNEDRFEAVFMGKYQEDKKEISFSNRLQFVRKDNNWLLNRIKKI